MKNHAVRTRLAVFLAAGAGTVATACSNQQEGLLVRRAIAWPIQEEGAAVAANCTIDASNDAVMLEGILDAFYGTEYLLPLEVANNMLDIDPSTSPNGINDGEIVLTEAEVELSIPQAPDAIDAVSAQDEALTNFTWPLQSLSVMPGESVGVAVEAVPAATTQSLAAALQADLQGGRRYQLIATVYVRGYRAVKGGSRNEIESRAFRFPIELCWNCLLSCDPCTDLPCDPTQGVEGGVCGNGQDVPFYPSACLMQ